MYIKIDIDNVGKTLEKLLLSDEIDEANNLQILLKDQMKAINSYLSDIEGLSILYIGGDDFLLKSLNPLGKEFWVKLKDNFYKHTKMTLTIGIGLSIEESIVNLKEGKRTGKNKIVSTKNLRI